MNSKINLPPKYWHQKALSDALQDMASAYERITMKLRSLSSEAFDIGLEQGLSEVTATGIVTDALNAIAQDTPRPAHAVRAAANYERNIGREAKQ